MSKVLDIHYNEALEEKFNVRTAMEEASRCLLCHDAPCSKSCPAGTNPGSFIKSIRLKNIKGAAETIRTNNPLGGSCSLICPHDKMCEGACSRTGIDKPIKIGKLQEYVVEQEKAMNMEILKCSTEKKDKKIACVGSGPASLACAATLAVNGYDVTVFEAESKIGGLLTYGINPSRISTELTEFDIEKIKDLGVKFVLNTRIEGTKGIEELKEEFDAVHVACGLSASKELSDSGIDYNLSGVRSAIEFLKEARESNGEATIGKDVVIIGGGDVAMDCALTAKQMGANVTIVYRRNIAEAPASAAEINTVQKMGISIVAPFAPEKTIAEDGNLVGISFKSRDNFSELNMKADTMIIAVGQEVAADFNDFKPSEGIFASGDFATNSNTVVQAVADGKKAAQDIDIYLNGKASEKVVPKKDLSIDFLGVKCENPFFLSSSPVCSNYDMIAKAFDEGWAGIYYKTVGIFIPNECSPRFDITTKESTSWTGFKNMEMISDKPLELNLEYISRLKKDYPTKVIAVSIMGSTVEEWEILAREVTKAGADLIECNFSCPNMVTDTMGSDVGQSPELVFEYTQAVVRNTHLPVIAKMTPNVGIMEVPAIAAIKAGAKGIAAINTIKCITNLDLDYYTGKAVVNGKSAISGYSGAAVKPIALRFIKGLATHPETKDTPITGIGGIETWQDALEFILMGSSNLQVTTSVMQYGYRVVQDMISGLSFYMEENSIDKLEDLIGLALPNIVSADELDRDFLIEPKIDREKCVKCGRCYVSCYDAAHQAIDWDEEKRIPKINDKCVGCHLCINVCPVYGCITPGEIKFKEGATPREIKVQKVYN